MSEIWTPTRILSWTASYLERHGDAHPRLSAEWLLSAVTGLSRVELYTNYDKPLSTNELAAMHAAIERRAAGEPLQYVTGEMPFRHIVMRCEPNVLIPRPETEVLVDHALAALVDVAWPRVLEIGSGTGCIACSLAREHEGTRVIATDLSETAASLTDRNAQALGLGGWVDALACDLADGVCKALFGTFDLLVSNPPYIPTDIIDDLPREVSGFEPHLALDGGADGLDVFRRILDLAPRTLREGGVLAVELGEYNVGDAAELVRGAGGWRDVVVHDDLTHRPRVLVAVWEG